MTAYPRTGTLWSAEEVASLIELRMAGMGWDYICATLRRSRHACQDKYQDYKFNADEYIPGRREARLAHKVPQVARTDLTGIVCGDPPPGRSALEKAPGRERRPISLAPVLTGATA